MERQKMISNTYTLGIVDKYVLYGKKYYNIMKMLHLPYNSCTVPSPYPYSRVRVEL